ncbi:hypothetical protein DB91_00695 [Ehrlichia sp. Wisconsin_h]|uniref:TRP75-related protein n=1 Tax=Ehrlichia sp. Wisconsin_h TaxID=1423420 RepID=UPI000A3AA9EA|nr:TRP75-related protein [Ehrlichia sp. Wisconsin_h]OUC04871.1 hypothetical protein DB91_00695 [Ehrlichia sp. Wisconsin_h]
MFRRNILNILLVLIFSFVISCSNKSRYQFSRKYSPIYNPDGEAFDSNVEFARDYSIYKEHRDALTSGVDKNSKSVNTRRKVKPKAQVKDKEYEAFLKEEGHDSMIDSNGINLIDVAGAKFIDPMEDDNGVDVQDVKDKNEVPVAKAADKTKLQDVKNEPPVAKAADKTKLQDVKNEVKPLITTGSTDDTPNLSDNGDNQVDKKDKGFRSLLKFTKIENNKDKNSSGDSENHKDNIDSDEEPVLSQSEHDVEPAKPVSEGSEQKNNYKAVHFLSFLKEQNKDQNDTTEELQEAENKNDQDNSTKEQDNAVKDNVEISGHNGQIDISNNGNNDEQVVIMSEEEKKDYMLLQRIKEMKEYDEDYSITYYYND